MLCCAMLCNTMSQCKEPLQGINTSICRVEFHIPFLLGFVCLDFFVRFAAVLTNICQPCPNLQVLVGGVQKSCPARTKPFQPCPGLCRCRCRACRKHVYANPSLLSAGAIWGFAKSLFRPDYGLPAVLWLLPMPFGALADNKLLGLCR